MTTQRITRRLILIGAGVGLAAAACGDDDETTAGSGGATASSSNANSSSGNTGGANAGGNGAGGDGSGGDGNGGTSAGMCGAALLAKGSNYAQDPHDLVIPLVDIEAGVEKQYSTTVANNHKHDIIITAADFAALQNGDTIKKYVCPQNGTDHEWVLSCADPNIMPTFEGEIGTPGNCPA